MEEMNQNPSELESTHSENTFSTRIDLTELKNGVEAIKHEIGKVIIGQHENIELMIVSLLCGGHVLLEGVPGVAKTLMAKLLAMSIEGSFKRIQFTPDLMPSDIIGTSVFNPKTLDFEYKAGPIFANILLIDEVNRSPAKTQAALFELMEERQVTVDGISRKMEDPFLVIATQNPIEQEGTYRLPEAQIDRFFMKLAVKYPSPEEEFQLLKRFNGTTQQALFSLISHLITLEKIRTFRQLIGRVIIEDHILRYIIAIIQATRNNKLIDLGGSPRASLALMNAAKAMAAISGRDFAIPEDIKTICMPVLRHRIILTAEAEMEGVTTDTLLTSIINGIEIPR